ncbi:hypothetical protein LUZ60_016539 [Juncus effusus]|nr:hypothetical protein LUZ60_016539 [Juncus effusus]
MLTLASSAERRRSLRHLLRLFSSTTPSPLSPSAIKSLIIRELDPDRALSLLSSLPATSSSTNYAVGLVASRLVRSHRLDDAAALIDSRLSFASAEPDFVSLLVSYGRVSLSDRALSAFNSRIINKSLTTTVISLNGLLSAFLQSGDHSQVPHLFKSISEQHSIEPDGISYGILFKALCESGKTSEAFLELKRMREEKRIEPTASVYTTLLDTLYKENKIDEADRLWEEMVKSECKLDTTAYNVKILHHSLNAEIEKVLEVMNTMEEAGVKPDTITYNFLMICHFKSGQIEEGKNIYRKMLGNKMCNPNAKTYKYLLEWLCKCRDFETGFQVFRDSLKRNRIPDFRTLKMFVEGLVKEGMKDRAKVVIREVRKRFPANLANRWDNVERDLGLEI